MGKESLVLPPLNFDPLQGRSIFTHEHQLHVPVTRYYVVDTAHHIEIRACIAAVCVFYVLCKYVNFIIMYIIYITLFGNVAICNVITLCLSYARF